MLTSDRMIDPKFFTIKNRPRNRRAFFLVALLAGSFVGAATYRKAGSAWAIFISAIGKLVVTIMFMFNGAEKTANGEDDLC